MNLKVNVFTYNGMFVSLEGNKFTDYTAEFIEWTEDPGITKCICSDGKERLIPSICLWAEDGGRPELPEQDTKKAREVVKKSGFYIGKPSKS